MVIFVQDTLASRFLRQGAVAVTLLQSKPCRVHNLRPQQFSKDDNNAVPSAGVNPGSTLAASLRYLLNGCGNSGNYNRWSALFKDCKNFFLIGSNNLLNLFPLPESNKRGHGPDRKFLRELL